MTPYQKIFDCIDQNFPSHIENVQWLVRQPSISLTGRPREPEVVACADRLLDFMKNMGCTDVHKVDFLDGNPVVYGKLLSRNAKAKTLIVYSLYDVMPVDEPDWVVDPFAAEILDATRIALPPSFGKCIVGRGVRNQKGPLMACLNALRCMVQAGGDIPVNVIFNFDGEEELASPHYGIFVERYQKELAGAAAVYYLNPSEDADGVHHLYLGNKGIIWIEVEVKGGNWGGPVRQSLFSADEIWVDSPAWRLVEALSTLRDRNGKCLIRGFYDQVKPFTPEEEELIRDIEKTFDEEREKLRLGIKKFKGDRPGREYLREMIGQPLINIDGYLSGYIGPAVKSNFPHRAQAKLDIRLVPDMDHRDILQKLRRHLDENGFPEVEVSSYASYNASKSSKDAPIVQALVKAAQMHGAKTVYWPFYYASVPLAYYSQPPLNLPAVGGGLGKMGRPHMANEFFTVEGLKMYEKYLVTFFHEFAKL